MMNLPTSTLNNFSVAKAYDAQKRLSDRIIVEDRLPQKIKYVAGVDIAYSGDIAVGAAVVLDYQSQDFLESQTAICEVKFPYIPTLLSFREIPTAVACVRKLRLQPDIFLVDGHGRAHPNRCGFASHLGLAIGKPTVGVAKSRLIGLPTEVGSDLLIVDKGQIIGSVVTTQERTKPLYVSTGNMVSLETAVKILKHCICKSRIPEPIRLAHKIASEEKRKMCGFKK
jgi:deoxyribonuclease V